MSSRGSKRSNDGKSEGVDASPSKMKRPNTTPVEERDNDDDDAKSEEEEEEEEVVEDELVPLIMFPPEGPRRYVLQRASGTDILSPILDHNIEGYLEINESDNNMSAAFYVNFHDDKGAFAGRIDNKIMDATTKKEEKQDKEYFFTAIASKLHIDYGIWNGTVVRSEGDYGVTFLGSKAMTGAHVAEVGSKDITPQKPYEFKEVQSVEVNIDIEDERIGCSDEKIQEMNDEGYKPLCKGCLCFVFPFEINDDGVPCLSLWFRPTDDEEQKKATTSSVVEKSSIPPDVLKGIQKLPQKHS